MRVVNLKVVHALPVVVLGGGWEFPVTVINVVVKVGIQAVIVIPTKVVSTVIVVYMLARHRQRQRNQPTPTQTTTTTTTILLAQQVLLAPMVLFVAPLNVKYQTVVHLAAHVQVVKLAVRTKC